MNRYKLVKAGVDVNQAIRRLDNDKEFYETLLKRFCEDAHYDQLKNALEQGDVQLAFQNGHAMKGMAGNLSLTRLHAATAVLVDQLRNGNLEGGRQLFGEVTEAYTALLEAIGQE